MDQSAGRQFRIWGRLAALLVSATALFVIFQRINPHAVVEVLARVKITWLLCANGLYAIATLSAAARWHLVLRLNHSAVHAGATARMVFIGHFFNTLLFGPAGGDLAKAGVYSEWYRRPMSSILATCYLERIFGGLGFLLLSALVPGLAAASGGFAFGEKLIPSGFQWWLLALAIVALAGAAVFFHRRFRHISPLQKLLQQFIKGAGLSLSRPRQAFIGTLLGFLAHLCTNVMLLLCLQAVVEQRLSFGQMLWTSPVIALVSAAPVTFAGTGLREGAALVLFGLYGIAPADAVAGSLLVFLSYLCWASLGGAILFRERRRQQNSSRDTLPQTISAVIPTLNEASALEETVHHLQNVPEVSEIIVVDGGSHDETLRIAERLGLRVLSTAKGRGSQLRAGAEHSTGDIVLLLHADTWLPPEAGRAILDCLRDSTVVAGGFWKVFRERKILMIGSRFRCAVRLWLGGRLLGDQAMFVRREALKEIGGIPSVPLMEEFELCHKLHRLGRLALAGATVSTSARRFAKHGILRTYWRMWRVTAQYYLGASPQKLQRLYEKE